MATSGVSRLEIPVESISRRALAHGFREETGRYRVPADPGGTSVYASSGMGRPASVTIGVGRP